MVAQVNYQKGLSTGLPGLVSDIGPKYVQSFNVGTVDTPISYGLFVQRSAVPNRDSIQLGASQAIGVTARGTDENTFSTSDGFLAGQKETGEPIGVLRDGVIWAQFDGVGGAIAVGDLATINGSGKIPVSGTGTATQRISIRIQSLPVNVSQENTGIFIGQVRITTI